jgi:hypothetical protein
MKKTLRIAVSDETYAALDNLRQIYAHSMAAYVQMVLREHVNSQINGVIGSKSVIHLPPKQHTTVENGPKSAIDLPKRSMLDMVDSITAKMNKSDDYDPDNDWSAPLDDDED